MAGSSSQQKCHLTALPPELRLRIYEALFEKPTTNVVLAMWKKADFCAYTGSPYQGNTQNHAVALMKCCKQLHAEVAPMMRERLSFKLLLFGEARPSKYDMSDM